MFEFDNRKLVASKDLRDAILDSTTSMLFSYLLGGNEFISSVEDIMMIVDLAENIKSMSNAAFFTVTKVGLNFGINYIKHRAEKISGNATYALSAIV